MKLFIFGAAFMMLADAQATRTWVSGVGDDVNPCSRTAPCKTFAGAISKTAAGGEISVLDPAGLGSVTIVKGMTLNGDGILASILGSPGVPGITINAGATDVVTIRGLSLNGIGGTNGINFVAGGTLIVENCTIYGYALSGIVINGPGNLIVRNTTITGFPGAVGSIGVKVSTVSGAVTANLSNVAIRGMVTGVDAQAGLTDVSNSVISLNSSFGVLAENIAVLSIENSILTNNGTAIQANLGATARISGNIIHDNAAGFGCGGTIATSGNNAKTGDSGTMPSCPPNGTIGFK